jgi:hypothetical protein
MTLIAHLFEKLAITTWDAIGNAFEHRISYGEDAITSIILLALKNASFPNLAIADTRPEESTKGCDFEFWIGDYPSGWVRYAIQAKKITVSSDRYASLKHTVGGVPQIEILEKYAKANSAIPMYCLFNYTENSSIPKSPCPKFINIKEYGCSITPSSIAKLAIKTRGARNFNWFHSRRETLPWSCLVRCPELVAHWPEKILGMEYENAVHKELPGILSVLLKNPKKQVQFIDTNVFSQEIEYRPRWIGVVNTEGQAAMDRTKRMFEKLK